MLYIVFTTNPEGDFSEVKKTGCYMVMQRQQNTISPSPNLFGQHQPTLFSAVCEALSPPTTNSHLRPLESRTLFSANKAAVTNFKRSVYRDFHLIIDRNPPPSQCKILSFFSSTGYLEYPIHNIFFFLIATLTTCGSVPNISQRLF